TRNFASNDLRLWRLPQTSLRRTHAAPLQGPDLVFDGAHLAAVDGRRAGGVDAWSGQPLAPAVEHLQPVSFAELSADGATLVVVSGRELFAWDWRQGKQRFAPIAFPNSPQRFVVSPTQASVLVAYADYRDGRLAEVAQVFGLE